MNRVQLIGVLVWPVEVRRDRRTGERFAKAMIAVSSDTNGLHFVPLTIHGREAIDAEKYLGEGSRLYINGHLDSVLVHDRDRRGNRHTRRVLYIIADRVTYLTVLPPRGGELARSEDRQR